MLSLASALLFGSLAVSGERATSAVPLVVHGPFFNLGTTQARATDGPTTHASGRSVPMCVLARVDGHKVVRLLGAQPEDIPAPRESSSVLGFTTTRFVSLFDGVKLELAFVTPALPEDLERLAWPVTYVELRAWSQDEREHAIDLYMDIASLAVVEGPLERVRGRLLAIEGLETAAALALDAPMASATASSERLSCGQVLVSARAGALVRANFGPAAELRRAFVERRRAEVAPEFLEPRPAADSASALSIRLEGRGGAGYVSARSRETPVVARALIAYDEPWSVRWCEEWLAPYWRRDAADAAALLQAADAVGTQLIERCAKFDDELTASLCASIGPEATRRCQEEYLRGRRQSALCADANGRPLLFTRGEASGHAISEIDALVEFAPQQLLLSSDLAKALLVPMLERSDARDWTSPFPPHDLGIFPHALRSAAPEAVSITKTASDCARVILLVAAICEREDRVEFAARYWKQLSTWARHLAEDVLPARSQELDPRTRETSILALGAAARLSGRMGSVQRSQDLLRLAQAQAVELERSAPDALPSPVAREWDAALELGLMPAPAEAGASAGTDGRSTPLRECGGYLRALADEAVWNHWFARGTKGPLTWAPAPIALGQPLVPDARSGAHQWSWTASAPSQGWQGLKFDAADWARAPGAFGAPEASCDCIRTPWNERSLWLRRSFELPSVPPDDVRLSLRLIGEAEVWINGVFAARVASGADGTLLWKLTDDARAALTQGRNMLAVGCTRERDDALFDAGLVLLPRVRR